MASRWIYKPNYTITKTLLGYTSVAYTNPVLFLEYGGVVYSSGARINYSQGNRFIYPAYDSSNNSILICCQSMAITGALPQLTISNIGVYIIG
jgi:hypothetical protein